MQSAGWGIVMSILSLDFAVHTPVAPVQAGYRVQVGDGGREIGRPPANTTAPITRY